jgi:hypothetical protein
MTRGSTITLPGATQERLATRKAGHTQIAPRHSQLLAERVGQKVESVRLALVMRAPKGFAARLATALGWRVERRSRELSGVEKLSLADVIGEIEMHHDEGRPEAADAIVAALFEGVRTATVPLHAGSIIRVFDEAGQLVLRFEQ